MEPNTKTLPAYGASVTAAEIYAAAREVCSRLYIANGGSANDSWTIKPFPGTAAIGQETDWNTGGVRWRLHMPAMPLDARLSRREAEVMTAYTVHELGHALFTDFDVAKEARKEGLAHVLNGLEDIRIERDLTAKRAATNARELLEILTEYTTLQSLANGWTWDKRSSLPFSLFQLGAIEVLGYAVPSMPAVALPELLAPIMREAVARVARTSPGRPGTREVLEIARWLKAQLAALPAPKNQPRRSGAPSQAPQDGQDGQDGQDEGNTPENENAAPEASTAPQEASWEEASGEEASGQDEAKGESQDGEADESAPGGARASQDEGQDEGRDKASDASGPGGDSSGDAWNPNDTATESPEVNLDDMGERACGRNGQDPEAVARENMNVTEFLNAVPGIVARRRRLKNNGTADAVASMIATPAKLRRDVTKALRSPEALDNLRRESRGRFDMRDVTRASAGAVNVFRRREESPGQSTAVALLLDMSSSMIGPGIRNAVALALHLGDACKACSVPFEVLGFTQPAHAPNPQSGILEAKSFRDPWPEAREFVASMANAVSGGTAMMPAMIDVAKRLRARKGVSRRIMIVLTDGEDGFSYASIRAAAKNALARDGVETIMIGAGTDVARLGLPHVNVWNLRDVAQEGLTALTDALARRPGA